MVDDDYKFASVGQGNKFGLNRARRHVRFGHGTTSIIYNYTTYLIWSYKKYYICAALNHPFLLEHSMHV